MPSTRSSRRSPDRDRPACPSADGSSLSNNAYTVSIDANGDISQIVDKQGSNRNLFSQPHRWELRTDNSDAYPAWEVLKSDVMSAPTGYVDQGVSATVTENGPVRVSVRVTRNKNGSNYTHYYRLCADSAARVVTVDDTVFWNTPGYLLKAAFYFTCGNPNATYSVGVGTIDRPTSGTDARYEVPAQLGDHRQRHVWRRGHEPLQIRVEQVIGQ